MALRYGLMRPLRDGKYTVPFTPRWLLLSYFPPLLPTQMSTLLRLLQARRAHYNQSSFGRHFWWPAPQTGSL